MTDSEFATLLEECATLVDQGFAGILGEEAENGEVSRPTRLIEAMRYATMNGGKRIRPFLLLETAILFEVPVTEAIDPALAIECIHCYSLVHDDLPAMDDDDLRRGKPTTHKAFDEATAILVGDALLTRAFELLADYRNGQSPEISIQLVKTLSQAAGLGGMVGGQMLDMQADKTHFSEDQITIMQSMKTGMLLKAACQMGALIGAASPHEQKCLTTYGGLLGQAFQIADDILDRTATAAQMGKAVAKDNQKGKATLVDHLGIDGANKQLRNLVEEAHDQLSCFGNRGGTLRKTATFIASRKN